MEKVGVYCRVSSDGQVENTSLDNQERDGRTFCQNNNYEPIVFRDSSTGSNIDREGFESMLDMIENGLLDGIWFWKTDRILRDLGIWADLIKLIRLTKIKLFVDNRERNIDDNSDYLLMGIESLQADMERRNIAIRTRRGKVKKLQEGKTWFGRPPIGYKTDKGSGLKIIKHEAKIIRECYRQYLLKSNRTYDDVIEAIKNSNLDLPRKFHAATLGRVLRNPIYMGGTIQTFMGKEYKFTCPEIVDKETWTKAQGKVMTGKQTLRGKRVEVYPLGGLLKCKDCGANMTMIGTKDRKYDVYHRWYTCKHARVSQATRDRRIRNNDTRFEYLKSYCNDSIRGNKIRLELIEEAVWNVLHDSLIDSKELIDKYKKSTADNTKVKNQFKGKLKFYEKKLENIKDEEANLTRLFAQGKIEENIYNRTLKQHAKDAKETTERYVEVDQNFKKMNTKVNIKDWLVSLKEDIANRRSVTSRKDRKRIINKWVDKVEVKLINDKSPKEKEYEILVYLYLRNKKEVVEKQTTFNTNTFKYNTLTSKSTNKPQYRSYNFCTLDYNILIVKIHLTRSLSTTYTKIFKDNIF